MKYILVAILVFLSFGCGKDSHYTMLKPPEIIHKVKILKLLPQSSGVIVSVEDVADGKRSSIKVWDGEAIPQESEIWEIKLEPICRAHYIFVKKSVETSNGETK